jgi:hypothetical protein
MSRTELTMSLFFQQKVSMAFPTSRFRLKHSFRSFVLGGFQARVLCTRQRQATTTMNIVKNCLMMPSWDVCGYR